MRQSRNYIETGFVQLASNLATWQRAEAAAKHFKVGG
jgi:hypothetical protein